MSERSTCNHLDRLHGPSTFKAIFDRGVRETAGPLVGVAVASGRPTVRIGISVPKRVGNAVRRNRVKRMIREAFRLAGEGRSAGLDIVVVVRPHEPRPLEEYGRWVGRLLALHAKGARRAAAGGQEAAGTTSGTGAAATAEEVREKQDNPTRPGE